MLKIEIVYDDSLIKEFMMIFKQSKVEHYTLIENVKGMGEAGGKFGNATAPGKNSILIAVVSKERGETLLRTIRKFKETNPNIGVKVFVSEICEFI